MPHEATVADDSRKRSMGRIHFDTSPKHRRYIAQFKLKHP